MYDLVVAKVAEVLEMNPDRIEPTDGFFQLGMDSIMAAKVRIGLETALGRKLPAPVMFEHPTTAELAAHLVTLVGRVPVGQSGDEARSPESPPTPPAHTPTDQPGPPHGAVQPVDDLTEEELLAVLAEEIQMANGGAGEVR
jgi:myxalamid-type polyketide synthase MxaE and MxaD